METLAPLATFVKSSIRNFGITCDSDFTLDNQISGLLLFLLLKQYCQVKCHCIRLWTGNCYSCIHFILSKQNLLGTTQGCLEPSCRISDSSECCWPRCTGSPLCSRSIIHWRLHAHVPSRSLKLCDYSVCWLFIIKGWKLRIQRFFNSATSTPDSGTLSLWAGDLWTRFS